MWLINFGYSLGGWFSYNKEINLVNLLGLMNIRVS